MRQIELLAPAKDYLSAVAAVDYGADAVYIGGEKFGARHAAGNSLEDIARVVDYAHRYGVRVHATLNTLLWDSELEQAREQAMGLIGAGVDALIVQDMALRRMDLPVELHASTQVCNTTPEGVRFLGEVGFSRVILERGLTLEQIAQICKATSARIECFVHGAICVGYSGRCYLSRGLSERSGNRGQCSQPCRLTYDLTDGKSKSYISSKHLLSVRDLNLSQRIGPMLDAGVSSFKIEGRLKDINYIRNVVGYYRQAIDRELEGRGHLCRASWGETKVDFAPDLSKSFTRGESQYMFDSKCSGVASFDTPKAVGEFVGLVSSAMRGSFRLDRPHTLSAGDGICFLSQSGFVGTNVNISEAGVVTPNRPDGIEEGVEIYRNLDIKFNRLIERSRTRRVIRVSASVEVSQGWITLKYIDCQGVESFVERSMDFETAKNAEANAASITAQASKSGDTIFVVEGVDISGSEWFVPASLVADMRREGLAELEKRRSQRVLEHNILPEAPAIYPLKELEGHHNVTNNLAEAFYRDHGVKKIARGLDLDGRTIGERVMQSAYCIRREIGECLLEKPKLRGELYLERGKSRYRLDFDCKRCEMSLVDCRENLT